MNIQKSIRLQKLPPYIFAQIDEKKRALLDAGKDLIDLGIGDPDLPTPKPIIKTLADTAADAKNHRYPSYGGLAEFKKACAEWMQKRFSVNVDPKTEVMSLIGSKEGLAHLAEPQYAGIELDVDLKLPGYEAQYFDLKPQQYDRIGWLLVWGVPLALLLAGSCVYWRRRQ